MPGTLGSGTFGSGTFGGPGGIGGFDLPFPIHAVARARYTLEAAWSSHALGIFTFDTSTIGGTDTLGVSPFDITFTGPYDNMSSIFDGARVNRGRNNTRDVVLAGGATIDVRDRAGMLNPENVLSPLYGELEDRLHPIRLKATFPAEGPDAVTYGIFYGWIRGSTWEPGGRKGTARLECVDLFWWLNRAQPVIAATGVTTTETALGLILDAVGWTDPMLRDLDTGDTIPDFSADGKKTALQLIQELLEAERGMFFINGFGIATYRDRLARATMTSLASVVDTMSALAPGIDFEAVRTRVTVTRTQNAYQAIATDDVTATKRGYDDESIETAYLSSNTAADDLAAFMLSTLKTPKEPLYDVTIDNRTADQLTQVLARDLVDEISVISSRGDVGGNFHIDQIEHTITRDRHTAVWLCSRETNDHPFLFDVSLLDGSDSLIF
jgi:hypothetical protein